MREFGSSLPWSRWVLAALAAAVLVGSACNGEEQCSSADEGRCGIVQNQVAVTFRAGTTRSQVDAINAEIGATVVEEPSLTTTYVIRLPEGWCYQRGISFYEGKEEVQVATVAVNSCPERAVDAGD